MLFISWKKLQCRKMGLVKGNLPSNCNKIDNYNVIQIDWYAFEIQIT